MKIVTFNIRCCYYEDGRNSFVFRAGIVHNKENSTNCQNTERPPQTQQYRQNDETEEYLAGKEQDKCPPNQTTEEEVGNLPDKEF